MFYFPSPPFFHTLFAFYLDLLKSFENLSEIQHFDHHIARSLAFQMTFSINNLRSDLRTFAMNLDVLNTFNDYDFFKATNVWSLAQVPLLPVSHFDLQEGVRKGLSIEESQQSRGNDAYVNMIFAFSPAGFKTAPIFTIHLSLIHISEPTRPY